MLCFAQAVEAAAKPAMQWPEACVLIATGVLATVSFIAALYFFTKE